MKIEIVQFGLVQENTGYRKVENSCIFADDDVQVLNFSSDEDRESYINYHKINIIDENTITNPIEE
jgi:hypothetical protein